VFISVGLSAEGVFQCACVCASRNHCPNSKLDRVTCFIYDALKCHMNLFSFCLSLYLSIPLTSNPSPYTPPLHPLLLSLSFPSLATAVYVSRSFLLFLVTCSCVYHHSSGAIIIALSPSCVSKYTSTIHEY
jgi:hypothetical protein